MAAGSHTHDVTEGNTDAGTDSMADETSKKAIYTMSGLLGFFQSQQNKEHIGGHGLFHPWKNVPE